ncbi:hypothetical protein BV20DRAFT_1121731 [Pilatotrama ljubarskyi]|nr:hypothetical protein BV20DRAFT_1121731 [Pilatotrama ljubarskyi]
MRPLISYDDIVTPDAATPQPAQHMNPPVAPPPAKKRKTNGRQGAPGGRGHQSVQHWDDPGSQEPQMTYDEAPATSDYGHSDAGHGAQEEAGQEEEEESRELTYDEIWDDSALIDAWNSAAAEYEAFHGSGKKWKEEPVKKSPLYVPPSHPLTLLNSDAYISWYNVPPATTSKPKAGSSGAQGLASTSNSVNASTCNGALDAETDSTPLNFDTYVPTHDPSLAAPGVAPGMDGVSASGAGSEAAMVSQDEAFSRAMAAMYWSGYWTAVYHCRRNEAQQNNGAEQEEDGGAEEEEGEDEEMLPAQR